MPSVSATIPHSLSQEQARARIDTLMDAIRRDYADMVTDMKGGWMGNTLNVSFKAYGFQIDSNVQVADDTVDVAGTIPLAAVPFKGKIKQTIVGKLEEVLA